MEAQIRSKLERCRTDETALTCFDDDEDDGADADDEVMAATTPVLFERLKPPPVMRRLPRRRTRRRLQLFPSIREHLPEEDNISRDDSPVVAEPDLTSVTTDSESKVDPVTIVEKPAADKGIRKCVDCTKQWVRNCIQMIGKVALEVILFGTIGGVQTVTAISQFWNTNKCTQCFQHMLSKFLERVGSVCLAMTLFILRRFDRKVQAYEELMNQLESTSLDTSISSHGSTRSLSRKQQIRLVQQQISMKHIHGSPATEKLLSPKRIQIACEKHPSPKILEEKTCSRSPASKLRKLSLKDIMRKQYHRRVPRVRKNTNFFNSHKRHGSVDDSIQVLDISQSEDADMTEYYEDFK